MKAIIVMLLLGVCLALPGAWDASLAWGQGFSEPEVMGARYSELARWQSWYGGGPSYIPAGLPGYGVDCGQAPPIVCEPRSFKVKKVRARKRSRK